MTRSDLVADLPEDCWEWILRRLDDRHLELLSLVCRRFLTLTNRLRSDLTLSHRTISLSAHPSRLFRRFPNIRRLSVRDFHDDLDSLLCAISNSGLLRLESLDLSGHRLVFPRSAVRELGAKMGGSIRVLNLSRFLLLDKDDLIAVADAFPDLEAIDISNIHEISGGSFFIQPTVTDETVAEVSSKLRNLRSARLSGNHFISDAALVSLSVNCPMLEEIVACDCSFMRGGGVAFALRHSPNLRSVSVSRIPLGVDYRMADERNLFFRSRALCRIELSRTTISDALLFSLGKAGLPLLEFSLSECSGFTLLGVSLVLEACGQSLRHLGLVGLSCLTDEKMPLILQNLGSLHSINLSSCHALSSSTFFSLVSKCSCLEEIQMEKTSVGKGHSPESLWMNSKIRSLKLACNLCLDDDALQQIARLCPGLHLLDVSYCWEVTENGIRVMGEMCPEIRELMVMGCWQMKNLGNNLGFTKLEDLQAKGSGLDDEALLMIGQSCKGLLKLNLEDCWRITEKGVKEVIRECKMLRELCLGRCCNINNDVLDWIVFSRRSLRKIVPPSGSLLPKKLDLFLRHGCMVDTCM